MRKSRILVLVIFTLFLSQLSNAVSTTFDSETHTIGKGKEAMIQFSVPAKEKAFFNLNADYPLDLIVLDGAEYLNYRTKEDYIAQDDITTNEYLFTKDNSAGNSSMEYYIIFSNPHKENVQYNVSLYFRYEFDMQTQYEGFKLTIPKDSTFKCSFRLWSGFNLYVLEESNFEEFWNDVEDNYEINSEHTYRVHESSITAYNMATTPSSDTTFWFVVEYPESTWGDVIMDYSLTPYLITGNSENVITGYPCLIFICVVSIVSISLKKGI